MTTLPPLPGHPEPHTYTWTALERAAIEQYGQQCAALASAQPAWQGIESAPRDGTAVRVANAHGEWIAYWGPVAASGFKFDTPWRSLMLNHDYVPAKFRYLAPTHWQPLGVALPQPPKD